MLAATAIPLLPIRVAAGAPLRVQGVPTDTGLEANYAESAGIVRKSGLTIDIDLLPNASAAQAAVIGGSIDIGNSTVAALAIARERGLPLAIIALAAIYTTDEPTSELMVPKDSPLKTGRDLNGKTVAVNGLNTIAQFGPAAWIEATGGNPASVHWLELPFAEMPVALARHRIDAALVAEPALTRARQSSRVLAKAYDAVSKRFLITAWYATQPWIDANLETAKRFSAMIYEAGAWANANRAQTARVLAEVGHVPPELVRSMNRSTYAEKFEAALLTPQLDAARKYGTLKAAVRPESLMAPQLLQ